MYVFFLCFLFFPLSFYFVCWYMFHGFPFLFPVFVSSGLPCPCVVLSFLPRSSVAIQEFHLFPYFHSLATPPPPTFLTFIDSSLPNPFMICSFQIFILSSLSYLIFSILSFLYLSSCSTDFGTTPTSSAVLSLAMLFLPTSASPAAASLPLPTLHGHAPYWLWTRTTDMPIYIRMRGVPLCRLNLPLRVVLNWKYDRYL